MVEHKKKIVIVGSGWAGYLLAARVDHKTFDVHIVSPRDHFIVTPLLFGAATGSNDGQITQPIAKIKDVTYHQASVRSLDIKAKELTCEHKGVASILSYDILVLAIGAKVNTFGIEGVAEHAFFLKELDDAMRIKERIKQCFNRASAPGIDEETKKGLLNFAVVGGGPTGIELAAELSDLIRLDLAKVYHELAKLSQITIYNSSERLLKAFDSSLVEFATGCLSKSGVNIKNGARIVRMKSDAIELEGTDPVKCGMVVWATGLMPAPLTKALCEKDLKMDEKKFAIFVNGKMQVYGQDDKIIPALYAIGDCAVVKDSPLPCTAGSANMVTQYLAKALAHAEPEPFVMTHSGMLAYVGRGNSLLQIYKDGKDTIKYGRFPGFIGAAFHISLLQSWEVRVRPPVGVGGSWKLCLPSKLRSCTTLRRHGASACREFKRGPGTEWDRANATSRRDWPI